MTKVTSVNLDEDAVEYFQSENINLSAWIRDVMEQRVAGKDIDIKQVRIRELEREREDCLTRIDRIDEQLEELREKQEAEEYVEEVEQSFGDTIIKLDREFQAFPSEKRMRRSNAFKRRAEEEGMSPMEAARKIAAYREAVAHE